MSFGKFSEEEIKKHISTISLKEMKEYNESRMKTYRFYTRLAYICGFAAMIFLFINELATVVVALIGFGIISITSFKRRQWRNLYENFVYLKKTQMKEEELQDKIKTIDKYSRNRE